MKKMMEELKLWISKKSAKIFTPNAKFAIGVFLFIVGLLLAESPQETYGRWLEYLPYNVESKISLFAIVAPWVMFTAGFLFFAKQIKFFRKIIFEEEN